jgi:drug/metabolite transporter (DMT)-like permease
VKRAGSLHIGRDDLPAVGLLLMGASAFAGSNVLSKVALDDGIAVGLLVVARFTVGAGILWIAAALAGVLQGISGPRRLGLLALGAGLSLQATALNEAFARVPAATASLLLYTYPTILTVLALLLRWEPAGRMKTLALVLSLAGIGLVFGMPSTALGAAGIVFALLAALLLAINTLIASLLIKGVHPLGAAAHIILGASLSSLAVAVPAGVVDLGIDAGQVALLVGIGVTASVIGPTSLLGALHRLGPSRTAIGSTFEPLATVVLAALLLGERLGPWQLLGGALILVAVMLLPVIKARWDEGAAPAGVAGRLPSRRGLLSPVLGRLPTLLEDSADVD